MDFETRTEQLSGDDHVISLAEVAGLGLVGSESASS